MSYPEPLLRWGLTPLQRCSRCILQPQPTRPRWFNVIIRTLVGGEFFAPLQRCSRYILLLQPTGLRWFNVICRTFVGGVFSLYIDAVGVFYNPNWWLNVIYKTLIGGGLSLNRDAFSVFYSRTPSWLGWNPASNTRWFTGELGISWFTVVRSIHTNTNLFTDVEKFFRRADGYDFVIDVVD